MERDKKYRLIGKYLSGNASPEEKVLVDDWARKSPENSAELEALQKLWNVSPRLKKEKSHDAQKAWEMFQEIVQAGPKIKKLSFSPLKIAAVLVLCVGTVFLLAFLFSDPEKKNVLVQKSIFIQRVDTIPSIENKDTVSSTAFPAKKALHTHARLISSFTWSSSDTANVFLLPDGSKVHLNKHSSITYMRSGRTVSLEGEAFFEVMPDSIPFFVSCKNTVVRVVGTSFNVKGSSRDEAVEVLVVTGLVEVSDKLMPSNKIELKAGDLATYNNNRHAFVKSTATKKQKWWTMTSLRNKIKKIFNKIRHKTN